MEVTKVWYKIQKDIEWFHMQMLRKLYIHRNKQYWMDVPDFTSHDALDRLHDEVKELDEAHHDFMNDRQSAQDVIDECADVANFAMMIAQKVQELDRRAQVVVE